MPPPDQPPEWIEWCKRVAPLVGPLVDAWDLLSNDVRYVIQADAPLLVEHLDRLRAEVDRQ